ncbi:hypothetical protein [Bradyrhizobium sp. CCBAU 11357]|uniref:hypothetical protein n=1 Tax=Bradyrhizobium sp. CCBAU 11357 TaxID=1630808 RepID=UPI00230449C9|nr:hypothetical protein [Bradyrhizobium sp. CCBAU 11357]
MAYLSGCRRKRKRPFSGQANRVLLHFALISSMGRIDPVQGFILNINRLLDIQDPSSGMSSMLHRRCSKAAQKRAPEGAL